MHSPSPEDNRQQIEALIRTLTNQLNQSERHHRKHVEDNLRNGVLLEGIFTRLDRQDEMLQRIYSLGMFWSEQEGD